MEASRARSEDGSDHPTSLLVELYALEQRTEVALSETLIALALDDLEENGSDDVLSEDLQQDTGITAAVDQDAPAPELSQILAVTRDARVDALVVGVGRVLKLNAAGAQRVDA